MRSNQPAVKNGSNFSTFHSDPQVTEGQHTKEKKKLKKLIAMKVERQNEIFQIH